MDLAIQGIPFLHGRLPENAVILATVLKVAGDEVLLELPGGRLSCRTQMDLTPGETLLMRVKGSPQGLTLQIVARGGEAPAPPPEGWTDIAHEVLTSIINQRVPPDSPLIQELSGHFPPSSPAPGEIPAVLHLLREELPVNPATIKALASYYHPRPSLTECLVDLAARLESLPMAPKEPALAAIRTVLSPGFDLISLDTSGAQEKADAIARSMVEDSTPEGVASKNKGLDAPPVTFDHHNESDAPPATSVHQDKVSSRTSDRHGASPVADHQEGASAQRVFSDRQDSSPAIPDRVSSGEALKDLLQALGVDHERRLLASSPRETMKGELLRLLQADLPLDVRRAAEEVLARLDVQQLLPGTRASVDGPLFLAHFEFPLNHEGRPHNVRVTLQGKSPGAEGLLRLFFLLESNHLGTLGIELIFNGRKVSCTTRAKDQGALSFLQERAEHWQRLFDGLGYELVHHRFRLAEAGEDHKLSRVDIKA